MPPEALSMLQYVFSAQALVWIIFFVALGLFGIMTAIFTYHWNTYSVSTKVPTFVISVYLTVGLVILACMAIVALSYFTT